MSQPDDQPEKKTALRSFNLALAAVTGQVGCLTVIIILAAFFVGRWLDNQFDSDAIFTVILMVASVPVTLVVMFWVVRSVTSRFAKPPVINKSKEVEEGLDRGRTP
jgi:O-antigen/teichoic acid export membrane protein